MSRSINPEYYESTSPSITIDNSEAPSKFNPADPSEIMIAEQIIKKKRSSNLFFKPEHSVEDFIKQLKKFCPPQYPENALLIAGSQLAEKQFNQEKDLDLELMLPATYEHTISSTVIPYIGFIASIETLYAGDHWILLKITAPHAIDLKINFSPKSLKEKILDSLANRRIPDALWDITNGVFIGFKDNTLRFLRKDPTEEDYAYALLQLALHKEKYPALSTTFRKQIKDVLAEKNDYRESLFFNLLRKKRPGHYTVLENSRRQDITEKYLNDIKIYLDGYVDPSLVAFPKPPEAPKHAANAQTLFPPKAPKLTLNFSPPVDEDGRREESTKMSYATALKK